VRLSKRSSRRSRSWVFTSNGWYCIVWITFHAILTAINVGNKTVVLPTQETLIVTKIIELDTREGTPLLAPRSSDTPM